MVIFLIHIDNQVILPWFVSDSDGFRGERNNMFDLVWLLRWSGPAQSATCSCLLLNVMSKHLLTHAKVECIKAVIVSTVGLNAVL